jgi:hypothetical protein
MIRRLWIRIRVWFTHRWVNVYLVDRFCYGPAEGGDWGYYGLPYELWPAVKCWPWEVKRVLARARYWCDRQNQERRSDIGSVLSEGRLEAYAEDHKAAPWPTGPRHYE